MELEVGHVALSDCFTHHLVKQKMKKTTTQALVIFLSRCVVHFLSYCITRLQMRVDKAVKLRFVSVRKSL